MGRRPWGWQREAGSLAAVRIVLAAVAVALLAAGCTSGHVPGPPSATGTPSTRPSASPTAHSSAAALARVPVSAVAGCSRATCQAIAVTVVRPGLSVALVRGPDATRQLAQTAYLLSLNATGDRIDALHLGRGEFFFDSLPKLPCDALMHCFVTGTSGVDTAVLNVIAVGRSGHLSDISQAGTLTVNTPNLAPVDLNEDGVAEILGRVNDFTPNYAGGSDYWIVWTWTGTRYAPAGCRKVQPGEDKPGGPVTLSSCPR
jgi:hypothetical protein